MLKKVSNGNKINANYDGYVLYKNNEVDITIVVNMLLTGFDSPITDVLWVDKKLEMHCPKEWAIPIIGEEEYNMLYKLQK